MIVCVILHCVTLIILAYFLHVLIITFVLQICDVLEGVIFNPAPLHA